MSSRKKQRAAHAAAIAAAFDDRDKPIGKAKAPPAYQAEAKSTTPLVVASESPKSTAAPAAEASKPAAAQVASKWAKPLAVASESPKFTAAPPAEMTEPAVASKMAKPVLMLEKPAKSPPASSLEKPVTFASLRAGLGASARPPPAESKASKQEPVTFASLRAGLGASARPPPAESKASKQEPVTFASLRAGFSKAAEAKDEFVSITPTEIRIGGVRMTNVSYTRNIAIEMKIWDEMCREGTGSEKAQFKCKYFQMAKLPPPEGSSGMRHAMARGIEVLNPFDMTNEDLQHFAVVLPSVYQFSSMWEGNQMHICAMKMASVWSERGLPKDRIDIPEWKYCGSTTRAEACTNVMEWAASKWPEAKISDAITTKLVADTKTVSTKNLAEDLMPGVMQATEHLQDMLGFEKGIVVRTRIACALIFEFTRMFSRLKS